MSTSLSMRLDLTASTQSVLHFHVDSCLSLPKKPPGLVPDFLRLRPKALLTLTAQLLTKASVSHIYANINLFGGGKEKVMFKMTYK